MIGAHGSGNMFKSLASLVLLALIAGAVAAIGFSDNIDFAVKAAEAERIRAETTHQQRLWDMTYPVTQRQTQLDVQAAEIAAENERQLLEAQKAAALAQIEADVRTYQARQEQKLLNEARLALAGTLLLFLLGAALIYCLMWVLIQLLSRRLAQLNQRVALASPQSAAHDGFAHRHSEIAAARTRERAARELEIAKQNGHGRTRQAAMYPERVNGH